MPLANARCHGLYLALGNKWENSKKKNSIDDHNLPGEQCQCPSKTYFAIFSNNNSV